MYYPSQQRDIPFPPLLETLRQRHAPSDDTPEALPRPPAGPSWFHQNRLNILLVMLAIAAVLSAAIHVMAPVLAASLGESLPGSWVRSASEQALEELDESILTASSTPLDVQEALRERFGAMAPAPEGTPPYQLIFRHSSLPGTGLITLPGGEIIVTDGFLRSVPDADEQLAVLCQALGHLYYRHALNSAIEHKLIRLTASTLLGDSARSIHTLTAGLREANYSLEQVREGDRYAVSMLRANHLPSSLLEAAIRHDQQAINPAEDRDPLAHRRFARERIEALGAFVGEGTGTAIH